MEQKISNSASKCNNVHIGLEAYSPKERYAFPLKLNHPSVQKVIQIALELSKENRVITADLLYNHAKKELKIPGGGLKKIIQILLNRKIIVDGSRFTRINVLTNKTRSFIYQLIKTHIGVHFSYLKTELTQEKDVEIGVGDLIWHLEKLLSFNLIKKVKVKNYVLFLPIEISDEEGILYFILRDVINISIVNYLLENGSVNIADLYKDLKVERSKVYYRIKTLIDARLISPLNDDEKKIIINSDIQDLIKKIILNISKS